jgi:hypothetical protein
MAEFLNGKIRELFKSAEDGSMGSVLLVSIVLGEHLYPSLQVPQLI